LAEKISKEQTEPGAVAPESASPDTGSVCFTASPDAGSDRFCAGVPAKSLRRARRLTHPLFNRSAKRFRPKRQKHKQHRRSIDSKDGFRFGGKLSFLTVLAVKIFSQS